MKRLLFRHIFGMNEGMKKLYRSGMVWQLVLVMMVTGLVYINTLDNSFLWDDGYFWDMSYLNKGIGIDFLPGKFP